MTAFNGPGGAHFLASLPWSLVLRSCPQPGPSSIGVRTKDPAAAAPGYLASRKHLGDIRRGDIGRSVMDWPTAAVLISVVIAAMVVLSTYLAGRFSKK